MAIQTETTYDVKIGLTTVDTIGLSNTLDTYTWDEIKDYNYVGSWTECYRQMSHRSPSNTTYIGYASTVGDCPFAASWYGGYTNFNISGYGTSLYNFDDAHGIYRKLILLNDSTDNYPTVITVNNRSNFKIITEFDAKKYALEYDAVKMLDSTFYSLYDGLSHQSLKYHTHLGQPNDDDSAVLISFRPYFIIEFENTYYCLRADIIAYRTMSASYLTNSGMANCYNNLQDVTNTNSKQTGICEAMVNWYSDSSLETAVSVPFIQNANSNDTYYCSQETYVMKIEFGINNSGFLVDYAFKTEEDLLLFIAGTYGIHFIVNETIYKPIITENFVVGYTDNLDTASDLDNYTDTDHDMPVTPPGPPVPPGDDEDNDDPLSSVGAPFGTGLAHYYVSTVDGAALNQISEAMSTWDIDATKKDLYRNLISCKIVKPPTAVPATPGVFEIYGVKPQYQGADITINEVTGNPDITFGPYSIDRKFNDFRDRAPYSRAEIFLPYCGWCALPSHVIGRSVSVSYYSDIIAGTVKAIVYCGSNPVAEASGVMSVDIPFAAENVGEKVAAANIGMLAYGRAAIQTAAGIGTAVASKGKSGWGNILSGGTAVMSAYNQLAQVENGNYTEICGKSGDGCALAGVDTIVIKITRPLYGGNTTAPFVPAGFAHTVGFVSMKQAKVNACNGLIVCDNVEVSGISGATDAERAEIKRVLESGLYVNSPPE